jgi:hypothetical protein
MQQKAPIIAPSGRHYGGIELFTFLSFLGFAGAVLGWIYFLLDDSSPNIFSGRLWVAILLSLVELVFVGLAIWFAVITKPSSPPGDKHDLRKLY